MGISREVNVQLTHIKPRPTEPGDTNAIQQPNISVFHSLLELSAQQPCDGTETVGIVRSRQRERSRGAMMGLEEEEEFEHSGIPPQQLSRHPNMH